MDDIFILNAINANMDDGKANEQADKNANLWQQIQLKMRLNDPTDSEHAQYWNLTRM